MTRPNGIADSLGPVLKAAGFKKKRADTWCRQDVDVISVLNLQKSNYSRQYYINVALWLKALGEAKAPMEHKCHIRFRLERLMPIDEREVTRLLNLEDVTMADEERSAQISSLIERHVIPFFLANGTLAAVKDTYQTNASLRPSFIAVARDLLGVDS